MSVFQRPLAQLIAASALFQADQIPYQDKLERDRSIAMASTVTNADARFRLWIEKQSNQETALCAERWVFSWHIVQLVLSVLGLFSGSALSAFVLQYDGSEPINIISSWIVLAGLPFLLMFFWLLTLLPFKIPVIPLLSEVLQRAIFKPLRQRLMNRLLKPSSSSASKNQHFTPSNKLLLAMTNNLMQWFALGLGIGSFLMAMYLLASSDLAFAWSTSIGITNTELHSITSFISAPFANFSGEARPALELIQNSHYFRLEEASGGQFTTNGAASQLTRWWPFIVFSIAFYAILPRSATLLISSYRLKKTISSDIHSLPDYAGLMNRMDAPLVTSRHSTPASELPEAQTSSNFKTTQFSLSAPLIYWNQIQVDHNHLRKALKKRGLTTNNTFEAGGRNSTHQDEQIIEQIVNSDQKNAIVLVKVWDAPISEMTDWLEQLCNRMQGSIIVLLINPDQSHQATHETLEQWRKVYHTLREAELYMEILEL